jgi:hypothetical protein
MTVWRYFRTREGYEVKEEPRRPQGQPYGDTLTLDVVLTMVRRPDGARRNPGFGTESTSVFPRNALRFFRATDSIFHWAQAPYFLSKV